MKKIFATMLSLITLLSMASPILAVSLSEYPDVLVKDNLLDTYIVVGSGAQPSDVVGAVDLAVRLVSENVEVKSIPSGDIAGSETNQVELGKALTTEFEQVMKDDDITTLKDDSLSFKGDDYDYHEELRLGSSKLKIKTSLTSDTDYGANPYLEVGVNDVKYMLVFDDDLDTGEVTDDNNLRLLVLGKDMKIVDFGNNEVKVIVADEKYLYVGDKYTANGYTVSLENVNINNQVRVIVTKDSQEQLATINLGETKEILGLEVRVSEVWYEDNKEERSAKLAIGQQVSKTYKDGDAFVDEDKNDPNWVWDITCSNDAVEKPQIGVRFDKNLDDISDNPVGVGEVLALPNNYIKLFFRDLINKEQSTFRVYPNTGVDLTDVGYGSSEDIYVLKSVDEDEGFFIDSDDVDTVFDFYTDTLYLYPHAGDIEVLYVDKDDNNVHKSTVEADDGAVYSYIADLKFDDTVAQVQLKESNGDLKFVFSNGEEIIVDLNTAMTGLGNVISDSEATDVIVNNVGLHNIGTRDDSVLTEYGVIIKNPENNANNDEVEFEVPEDQVKAVISIVPGAYDVEGTDNVVRVVKPIVNAVAKLDTEVSLPVGKNLILVGGPAVNKLTAQAMGYTYPTYGAGMTNKEFTEGQGFIKIYDGVLETGKYTVVVAGWEAEDTRNACLVMQKYSTLLENITSSAVKVTGANQVVAV